MDLMEKCKHSFLLFLVINLGTSNHILVGLFRPICRDPPKSNKPRLSDIDFAWLPIQFDFDGSAKAIKGKGKDPPHT